MERYIGLHNTALPLLDEVVHVFTLPMSCKTFCLYCLTQLPFQVTSFFKTSVKSLIGLINCT